MDVITDKPHIVLQQRQVIKKIHPWLRSHGLLMAAGGKEGDQFSSRMVPQVGCPCQQIALSSCL